MPTTPASYGFGTRQTSTRRRRDRFGTSAVARPGMQTSTRTLRMTPDMVRPPVPIPTQQTSTRSMHSMLTEPAPSLGLGPFRYSGEPGYSPPTPPQQSGPSFAAAPGRPRMGESALAGLLGGQSVPPQVSAAPGRIAPRMGESALAGLFGSQPAAPQAMASVPSQQQPTSLGPAPAQQPLTPPLAAAQPYAGPPAQSPPQAALTPQQQTAMASYVDALRAGLQAPRSFGFEPVQSAVAPSVPRPMGSGPAGYSLAMGNNNFGTQATTDPQALAAQQRQVEIAAREQQIMDAAAANGGLYTPLQNTPPVVQGTGTLPAPGQPSPFGTRVVQGQFGPRLVGAPRTQDERDSFMRESRTRTETARRRGEEVDEFRQQRMKEGLARLRERRFGIAASGGQDASPFGTRRTQRVNVQNTAANTAGATAEQQAVQGGARPMEAQQAKAQGVADEMFRQMQEEDRGRDEIVAELEKLSEEYPEGVETPLAVFLQLEYRDWLRRQPADHVQKGLLLPTFGVGSSGLY